MAQELRTATNGPIAVDTSAHSHSIMAGSKHLCCWLFLVGPQTPSNCINPVHEDVNIEHDACDLANTDILIDTRKSLIFSDEQLL